MKNFLHPSPLALKGFLVTVAFLIILFLKVFFAFPLMSFIIMGIGLVGFAIGLYCLIKYKEFSYAVWFSLIIGIFILFIISLELIFPH